MARHTDQEGKFHAGGHHPPSHHYPPPPPKQRAGSGRTNIASCIVAALFLILVTIVALILYFTLFKPKDPKISVNAIQLPSFTIANGTVSFTFSQYAAVENPNRAAFSHYDSSLQLLYAGSQLGFMYIPAGKVEARRTEYMAATFAVKSYPIAAATPQQTTQSTGPEVGDGVDRDSPGFEMESRMIVAGRVNVLHFFSHHVVGAADCRIAVSVKDGSVLGFHC